MHMKPINPRYRNLVFPKPLCEQLSEAVGWFMHDVICEIMYVDNNDYKATMSQNETHNIHICFIWK